MICNGSVTENSQNTRTFMQLYFCLYLDTVFKIKPPCDVHRVLRVSKLKNNKNQSLMPRSHSGEVAAMISAYTED